MPQSQSFYKKKKKKKKKKKGAMSKWHSSYLGKSSCILDQAASFAQISSCYYNGGHGKVPKTPYGPYTNSHVFFYTKQCYFMQQMFT